MVETIYIIDFKVTENGITFIGTHYGTEDMAALLAGLRKRYPDATFIYSNLKEVREIQIPDQEDLIDDDPSVNGLSPDGYINFHFP